MPSLAEAYERRGREREGTSRRVAGGLVFAAGLLALLSGVALASTDLYAGAGWTLYEARHVAGVLGGVGAPAMLVGVVVALPSSARTASLMGVGAATCLAGVGLFWYAYPDRWYGVTPNHLTLEVAVVYTAGALVALWAVLSAVATYRARNDPQGTVTVEVTRGGETRTVEVEGSVDRERLERIAEREE